MGNRGKSLAIIIIAIVIVSTILMVKSLNAQVGVTTPLNPSFSVSYDIFTTNVPPVYGVDSSSGKAVITQSGYTVLDETVYIRIVNQPFVPYKDSSDNNIQLFYNIRWKDPSNTFWIYLDEVKNNLRWTQTPNEEFTISSFSFKDNRIKGMLILDMPFGSETDFQVQALIGYYLTDNVFVGKTSAWNTPQSIQHATLPTDYNYPSPTVPEFPYLIVIFLLLSVLAIALIVKIKKLQIAE